MTRRAPVKWTTEFYAEVTALKGAGMLWREVARKLGMCESTLTEGYRRHTWKHAARPEFKPVTAPRTCLKCGQTFESEWAGNRMCQSCKAWARTLA
jgi:hypothetical protein